MQVEDIIYKYQGMSTMAKQTTDWEKSRCLLSRDRKSSIKSEQIMEEHVAASTGPS